MSQKVTFRMLLETKCFFGTPFRADFQTFSSSGSGEAQKADSGSDRNDKKTFFVCFADVTKNTLAVIQNQCLRKTLINSKKKLKVNY